MCLIAFLTDETWLKTYLETPQTIILKLAFTTHKKVASLAWEEYNQHMKCNDSYNQDLTQEDSIEVSISSGYKVAEIKMAVTFLPHFVQT